MYTHLKKEENGLKIVMDLGNQMLYMISVITRGAQSGQLTTSVQTPLNIAKACAP